MGAVVLVAAHHVHRVADDSEGGDGPGEWEGATGLPKPGLLDVDFDARQRIEVLIETATG